MWQAKRDLPPLLPPPRRRSVCEPMVLLAASVVLPLLALALTSLLYAHLLNVEHHLQQISKQLTQTLLR